MCVCGGGGGGTAVAMQVRVSPIFDGQINSRALVRGMGGAGGLKI